MALRASMALLAAALLAGATAAAAQSRPHTGYRIPPDNPFVSRPGARAEVYLRGMRNPYRWSFDRQTGDMYVADVGGDQREEVTYLPRARIAGANLGWHCFEGTFVQKPCDPANYIPPAHEYPSSPDVIIGGYVVHDPALPSFAGRYLYGRYSTGIWALGPQAAGPAVHTGAVIDGVTSFGEDGAGRLYATSYEGPLYRLGESGGALTLAHIAEFDHPVAVLSPPGDAGRLFVVEKRGRVRILAGGVVSDFLDIRSRVRGERYEEGLLGFVAAPDYDTSGRVFALYSDSSGDIQVDEYRRTARDPDRSNPSTRRPLLTIPHGQSTHHHGGQLNFGSDGYLYLSTGDGDLNVDPQNDAQRLDSLLGKILRIDVSTRRVDRVAPSLRATVARRQRVLRREGAVAYVGCSEPCSVIASARTRIGGHVYRLLPAGTAASAGRRLRVRVTLTAPCRRALRRALKRDAAVLVRLVVRGEDATGNSSRVTRVVRVTG